MPALEWRRWYRHLCLLLSLLPAASAATAQGSPPFITDDPGTPGPKRWEINLGFVLAQRPREYLLEAPDLDINYGIGTRLQIKHETSWTIAGVRGANTVSALGNSLIGIKWRFLDGQGAAMDASIFPQFTFNLISTREFGLFDRDLALVLPVQMETQPGSFNLVAEIGYKLIFEETDAFKYGVILGRTAGRMNVGAEIHGEVAADFSHDILSVIVES
jgi:hypothetical protein